MKKRLELIHYGLSESYKRFNKTVKDSDDNLYDSKIYSSISESLFWINTIDDYLKQNKSDYNLYKDKNNMMGFFSGVRFAYNSLKHNFNFIDIKIINTYGGFNSSAFNSTPFNRTEIVINWLEIPYSKGYKKQFSNYENYLKGKDVKETLDYLIRFIDDFVTNDKNL